MLEAYIPQELTQRKQWVLWKNVNRNGHCTKVPYQIDGTPAKSNAPDTWATFADALSVLRRGGYEGIGFVFHENDGIVGIDLDGCRNPDTGQIENWAKDIISRVNSYTEVSPSGSGVKIFACGTSPFRSGKNKNLPQFKSHGEKEAGIEIYDKGRFFAVTGHEVNSIE